jgi:hypothetical protein
MMITQPLSTTSYNRQPIYTLPTQVYQDLVRNVDAYGNKDGKADTGEVKQFGQILGFYAQAYGQAFEQTKAPIYKQVADMLMRDWYAISVMTQNYGRFAGASSPQQPVNGISVQDVAQVAIRDRDAGSISDVDFTTQNPYMCQAQNPYDWQFAYNQTRKPNS